MKYSDVLADWLVQLGYTHCFYLAGGNIMHLLESVSRRFTAIPVVHEVCGGIAAEYFTEIPEGGRAFALVTAGPGLTNIVTAMAGAFLESRELLVLGGQVKVPDLARGQLRQRGIQEIAGVDIARPVTVLSHLMDEVLDREAFCRVAESGSSGRKGPVFIEIPLDIQARDVDADALGASPLAVRRGTAPQGPSAAEMDKVAAMVRAAERPVLLLGGGVSRAAAAAADFAAMGVPVQTTWNGADRVAADHPLYFGRPNTWGQRYANLVLQQADLVVALGSRLGLQQTGFNHQEFAPVAKVVQVDCDPAELDKGHPRVDLPLCGDADRVLAHLGSATLGDHGAWVEYCREIKASVPLIEPINTTGPDFISPYVFCETLSRLCAEGDVVIPCSSGGAFTVMMQTFAQKRGQRIVTDKGLASMGYGLSGAIGAALAADGKRTVLVEGDGGFAQNLQEIGTVAANRLNLKMFVFDDSGYASIRMTQRNYFGGRYVGCDLNTGLGLPDWDKLFGVWGVPAYRLKPGFADDAGFRALFDQPGPVGFIVPVDPGQTYLPKIASRVTETGGMVSNPLHLMSPPLDDAVMARVGRYLPK
ncbi:MAG: thiamine pyrophosphate-binding protein [Solirubrobacterales bacterium]